MITVVDREQVSDTDFAGVPTKVKGHKPEAVHFGGEYPVGGPLSKQAATLGITGPLVGGDGDFGQKFISLGGKEGDVTTSVGATGAAGFDQYGDSKNKVLTAYAVTNGAWQAVQTGSAG